MFHIVNQPLGVHPREAAGQDAGDFFIAFNDRDEDFLSSRPSHSNSFLVPVIEKSVVAAK